MILNPTEADELLREAELVEANQLDSGSWVAAITCFDLIKAATAPAVLAVVDVVRGMNLTPSELAQLLRRRAEAEGGGR